MAEAGGVNSTVVPIGDLNLASGAMLRGVELAVDTMGQLNDERSNAILLTHGYQSSHRLGRRGSPWGALIGPGAAVDTNRWFVLSSNMLGSSYGSTGPGSLDPVTGRRYGPRFPTLTMGDIVGAQRALLGILGLPGLAAVVGMSFGGFQAFQWAVDHPDLVGAIAVASAVPHGPPRTELDALEDRLSGAAGWNGGDYYAAPVPYAPLVEYRLETLQRYGFERVLERSCSDPAARAATMRAQAERWATEFDANSLLLLRQASVNFDLMDRLSEIRAPLFLALCATDELFPSNAAPALLNALRTAGVRTTYCEIDSDLGHLAPAFAPGTWAPALAAFLDQLASCGDQAGAGHDPCSASRRSDPMSPKPAAKPSAP